MRRRGVRAPGGGGVYAPGVVGGGALPPSVEKCNGPSLRSENGRARKNRGARKKRARRRGRRALLPPTPSTSSHRGCDHPAPLREETAATRRRERGFPLATRAPATGARSRDGA